MTSWKLNLCKLHNEVFKAAESRINTECLPLVGGDVSLYKYINRQEPRFAPRRRGCFVMNKMNENMDAVCPS